MKFMPFDLESHLNLYNLTETVVKTRQDFGFLQAFNENSTTSLNLATELLHKSALIHSSKISESVTNLQDEVGSQIDNNDFKGLRLSLKKLAPLIKENDLQAWYSEQHRRLSTADLWEKITADPSSKKLQALLNHLKHQWISREVTFSAHSVTALSIVAENIAGFLHNYYQFANEEFRSKGYRIPKPIRQAYKKYLNDFNKKLNDLREDLCQNMLLRLQLATATGDISYNDHIHYTAQILQKYNLIKLQKGLPLSERHDLKADNFQKFLKYIVSYGTKTQTKALSNLDIFKDDEQYLSWKNDKTIILAPKVLGELAPFSPPWLTKLFKQRNFRYQFLEKNLWLFSSLRLLAKHPFTAPDILLTFNHFQEIEKKIEAANQEIEGNTISSLSQIFSSTATLFKLEWSQYRREAQILLLQRKIAFLAHIHQDLNRHNATFFDFSPLERLIDEVSNGLSLIHLSPKECELFYLVKAALLSKHKAENNNLPLATAQQRSNNPFDQTAKLPTNPFDTLPAAPKAQDHETDSTLFELLNNLQLMELDSLNFQETISSIKRAFSQISQQKQPTELTLQKKSAEKIFVQYLKKYILLKSISDYEKYQDKFLAIEQLLISFSEEHIRTRVQSIVDFRQQAYQWFALQLKCRSYLASYQQKIVPALVVNSAILNAKNVIENTSTTTSQPILGQ